MTGTSVSDRLSGKKGCCLSTSVVSLTVNTQINLPSLLVPYFLPFSYFLFSYMLSLYSNHQVGLQTLPGCLLLMCLRNLLLVFLKLFVVFTVFWHLTQWNLSSFLPFSFGHYFSYLFDAFLLLTVSMPPIQIYFSLLPLLASFLTSSLNNHEGTRLTLWA